jgi:hypothetical protein
MGGVNTPLLIRWPGVVPAARVDRQTALAGVDIFPTLLAATGVPGPTRTTFDGENMLAAWKGQSQARTKPLFWWWQGKHSGDDWPAFAMRDEAWMLILDETKQRRELYQVVADRAQQHNLAAEQPERVDRMQAAIGSWFSTLPKNIDPALQSKLPTRITPDPSGQKPNRAAAFARWDSNGDGVLVLDEYRAGLSRKGNAETRFNNFDQDGNGELSREEFVGE